jgi:hypothetical protein
MVHNLGVNTIMPVVDPAPLNKVGQYIFKINYSYQTPLPECASANPPCPIQPPPVFNFMAGQAVDGNVSGENVIISPLGIPIPMSVLALNPLDPRNTASRPTGDNSAKIGARDPWTGGVEWSDTFNLRNLFLTVVIIFLIYLFLKHMLPLIKTSLKKS